MNRDYIAGAKLEELSGLVTLAAHLIAGDKSRARWAAMISDERKLEEELLEKLRSLKYEHREDIRDRASLEKNFREKFQALNQVKLTDGEFQRLLDEIITPDVFTAAHTLRNRNSFTRDDGTPLNYTLVNIADWCKNTFEVISQLRINTD
jgi:type I restriction enzyme R subunit